MVSDVGIIATSLIGLAGMVLIYTLNNNQWFKKENFKLQKSNILNENKIKYAKLKKELGINDLKTPSVHETPGVMELIKGLDTDKISGILELLQGSDEEPEEKSDIMSLIDKVPPEAIQGILDGLTQKKNPEEGHYLS